MRTKKMMQPDDREVNLREEIFAFVKKEYGTKPEYLWRSDPDSAVLRHLDNQKWYGLILTVQRSKLSLPGEGTVEILDVRADPEELKLLIDGKRYFPGWHMNKKHWLTVPLDGTLPLDELYELIEESWHLAK